MQKIIIFIVALSLVVGGIGLCLLKFVDDGAPVITSSFELTVQKTDRIPPSAPLVGVGMVAAGSVIMLWLALGRMPGEK